MKTLVIIILLICSASLNGFAQNRIHGWEIEKITSVRVELTSPDDNVETYFYSEKQDIDTIVSFLKNVDFRELESNGIDHDEQLNNWRCKIVFEGQRDQVYLFNKSAFIGKTAFIIDDYVIEDFRNIIRNLED